MTTRKDLQEWLNRFPEDTIIEIGIQEEPHGYDNYGRVNFDTPILEDSDIGDGWEFIDLRGNSLVKPDAKHFDKCYLRIGEAM